MTKSGSGIDPHISPESAQLQVARVAQARHLDPKIVEELCKSILNRCSLVYWGKLVLMYYSSILL